MLCTTHVDHHDDSIPVVGHQRYSIVSSYCHPIIIRHVAYLQRTGDHGMTIGGNNGVSLMATVDTSYAPTDPYSPDLRSITGGNIHMSAETRSIISLLC